VSEAFARLRRELSRGGGRSSNFETHRALGAQELDAYLATQKTKWEALRIESETRQTEILQRLRNTAGRSPPSK